MILRYSPILEKVIAAVRAEVATAAGHVATADAPAIMVIEDYDGQKTANTILVSIDDVGGVNVQETNAVGGVAREMYRVIVAANAKEISKKTLKTTLANVHTQIQDNSKWFYEGYQYSLDKEVKEKPRHTYIAMYTAIVR